MVTTAPTAPGIPGAAPVTALPNNGGAAPTTPAPVPTSAPTGTTPTSAPAATTTAVSSPALAINQVNNQIKPALQQGQTAIATQNANTAAAVAANPYSVKPGETTQAYNARIAAMHAASAPAPAAPPTPEQAAMSNPDAGNKFIYDSQGNQTQVGVNETLPPGYSTTNPHAGPATPVADQTTDPAGNVIKQLTDGTYAKYSVTGAYIGTSTQNDFTNSKNGESALNSLNQLANGTFPLSANEQSQVDGIKAQFAALIATQQVANANLTGGTTIAENLYGMGSSLTGLGEIKGTVDSGIAKIADLNSKMNSAVASMEAGFRNDDIAAIKASYDEYSSAVKGRQDALNTAQAAISTALQNARAEQDKKDQIAATAALQDKQIAATKQDQADNDIRSVMAEAQKGNATAGQIAQIKTALANHDYAAAVQAAGGSLQDPTSPAGEYSAYVNAQKAAGKPVMAAGDFIAAQKYKEAYASASASAAVQATQDNKQQAKYLKTLQSALLSSRSDLGVQNKKVSQSIDLRTMLNQYKKPDGTYDVPRTNYTELAIGLANLLSPTGVAAQSTIEGLQQPTVAGSLAAGITYLTGTPQTGTTQDVLKNLSDSIDRQGQTAESLRNKHLDAQAIGLDPDTYATVISKIPSYDNMSQGDISYQSPEQISNTAKTGVQSFAQQSMYNAQAIQEMLQIPGSNYTTVAQKLGILPSTNQ